MGRKITDPKLKLFMEYFAKELGCKFIDADTGEEIEVEGTKDVI